MLHLNRKFRGGEIPFEIFSHTRSCEPEQLWRRNSQSEIFISNKHNDPRLQVIIQNVDTESGHLNDPGCEVITPLGPHKIIPMSHLHLDSVTQSSVAFSFLIKIMAQTNLDGCSRPLDVGKRAGATHGKML